MSSKRLVHDAWQRVRADPLIYGLAALVGFVLPFEKYIRGAWSWPTSLIAGILLVAAMLTILRTLKGEERVASTAQLVVRIDGDGRVPTRIKSENVHSWYWHRSFEHEPDAQAVTSDRRRVSTLLVIAFDVPVVAGTLEVQSSDVTLPPYEVKEFNNRLAVVSFKGDVPVGRLDIHAHP